MENQLQVWKAASCAMNNIAANPIGMSGNGYFEHEKYTPSTASYPDAIMARMTDQSDWDADEAGAEDDRVLQALPALVEVVRRSSGMDFSGYKTSTLCRRVQLRM